MMMMYIELNNIRQISWGGEKFTLSSDIIRFIEFNNVVVFLLDEGGKRDKIVGIKFSQAGAINHFYIDWEFQIIDGMKNIYPVSCVVKTLYNNQEVVNCYSGGFDIGYYLDPETGNILHTEPIR
jgi:hypothetical protein